MLGSDDPLPQRPRRILVAGVSGSGKSTLAQRISALLQLPYVELDALHHGPHWTPRAAFLDDVRSLVAQDAWVTEWQYAPARPLLAARADLLVWLDPPFLSVTFPRVVRRTLRRRLRREVLWNGNIEPPLRTFFTDPEHIVRWAVSTRNDSHARVSAAETAYPDLTVVRLRSPKEADQWSAGALLEVL